MSVPEEQAAGLDGMIVPKFTTVDYTVFGLMLAASVGIGVYSALRGRGNTSTVEYLLGGRTMSPVPVAFSILGTLISAISILGNATEMYFYGTQLCVSLLGFIPACLVVRQLVLPIFYNLKLVSMNEYIELRFRSQTLRRLVMACHLVSDCIYMGVFLYAPSLALTTVTHLSTKTSVLIMGAITTFYITIGGMKAVVYTDVVQTLVMVCGVLLVVVMAVIQLGGVNNIWDTADAGGRLEFFNLDPSPFVRHTFWSTLLLGFYSGISWFGFTQTCYQRFASVSTLKASKRLCVFGLVGVYCTWTLFFFSGLVAYATYRDCDPLTSGKIEKPDQIIPFMVMDKLSHIPAVPGVFVAAVYGGVLSSLSSCGNSMACMVWEDFVKHLPYFANSTDAQATKILQLFSAAACLVGTCLGLTVGNLGNIFNVINSITGAVQGPMVGVFLAGMCAPWINTKGTIGGMAVAIVYNLWLVVGKLVNGGGTPTPLPLATGGCNDTLATSGVSVHEAFFTNTTHTDVLLSNTPLNYDSDGLVERTSWSLYDVSYCYSGLVGILGTVFFSTVVSLCTGLLRPGDVELTLVHPSCHRFHHRLWHWLPFLPSAPPPAVALAVPPAIGSTTGCGTGCPSPSATKPTPPLTHMQL